MPEGRASCDPLRANPRVSHTETPLACSPASVEDEMDDEDRLGACNICLRRHQSRPLWLAGRLNPATWTGVIGIASGPTPRLDLRKSFDSLPQPNQPTAASCTERDCTLYP